MLILSAERRYRVARKAHFRESDEPSSPSQIEAGKIAVSSGGNFLKTVEIKVFHGNDTFLRENV